MSCILLCWPIIDVLDGGDDRDLLIGGTGNNIYKGCKDGVTDIIGIDSKSKDHDRGIDLIEDLNQIARKQSSHPVTRLIFFAINSILSLCLVATTLGSSL